MLRTWITLLENFNAKRAFDDAETPEDVARILQQAGARLVQFPKSAAPPIYIIGDYIVEWDGKDAYPDVETIYNWVSDADLDLYYPGYEQKWNDAFWLYPRTLYHATTPEKVDDILRDGLEPRDETRGISNRGVGAAVFTTTDEDEALEGHYGEVVLAIDTIALSRDPDRPYAAPEPPVIEARYRNALARHLGVEDFDAEVESGIAETTVILHGPIPPHYLRIIDDD